MGMISDLDVSLVAIFLLWVLVGLSSYYFLKNFIMNSPVSPGAGHLNDSEDLKAQHLQPFLRSCKSETTQPLNGKVTGIIPLWLQGSLVRNGPGLMEIGPDKFNHAFDGMALMHRFSIKDGTATYKNAFLRSNAFNRNMKANRIVVGEFGTVAFPDPCHTLYQRMMSYFTRDQIDNDNVNVLKIGDEYYLATETSLIHRIDPETLETKAKVNLSDFIAVNTATAHPHYEEDGTVLNMGSRFSAGRPKYCIIKFPPKSEEKSSIESASVLCSIPSSRAFNPSYFHSFAMTKNYCIHIEQSLNISLRSFAMAFVVSKPVGEALEYFPEQKVKFHIVRKDTGEILPVNCIADSFMLFHQINAYEEDDHLVVDMICYPDGSIVKSLYVTALKEQVLHPLTTPRYSSQARRYILPLNTKQFAEVKDDSKKIEFTGSKACAILQSDDSILCLPEVLSKGIAFLELPGMNYEKYNTKKYRYFYAICSEDGSFAEGMAKFDIATGKYILWKEEKKIPSEPVFVPSPDSSAEDDGVILASLLDTDDDTKVDLLILDAKSFKEIARVEFTTTSAVPKDFHGRFIS